MGEKSLEQKELAGGILERIRLSAPFSTKGSGSEQTVHVWTPPGYERDDAAHNNLPVLFLHSKSTLGFPSGWSAPLTAATLIQAGVTPPFILASMQLPREDAILDQRDGREHLDRLIGDLMPYMNRSYGASTDPRQVGIGGTGVGAMFALQAATRAPGVFGQVLAESPSSWVNEGRLLQELERHIGPLPDRLYLGVGGREYSQGGAFDLMDGEAGFPLNQLGREDVDLLLTEWVKEVAETLAEQHHNPSNGVKLVLDPLGTHTESAWRARLPHALAYLMSPSTDLSSSATMSPVVDLQDYYSVADPRGSLIIPSNMGLVPNSEFKVMINREVSEVLQKHDILTMHYSFNGWTAPTQQVSLCASQVPASGGYGVDLWSAKMQVPGNAFEMNFVFCEGDNIWENNNGKDFCIRAEPQPETKSAPFTFFFDKQDFPSEEPISIDQIIMPTLEAVVETSEDTYSSATTDIMAIPMESPLVISQDPEQTSAAQSKGERFPVDESDQHKETKEDELANRTPKEHQQNIEKAVIQESIKATKESVRKEKKRKPAKPEKPISAMEKAFRKFYMEVTGGRQLTEPNLSDSIPDPVISSSNSVIEDTAPPISVESIPKKKLMPSKLTKKKIQDPESLARMQATEDRLSAVFAKMEETFERLETMIDENAPSEIEDAVRREREREQLAAAKEEQKQLQARKLRLEGQRDREEAVAAQGRAERGETVVVLSSGENTFVSVNIPPADLIRRNQHNLFFTYPEQVEAGKPFNLFMLKGNTWAGLASSPRCVLHLGFNEWSAGVEKVEMGACGEHQGVQLWVAHLPQGPPKGAYEMSFVFSDGGELWDNNDGRDFVHPIHDPTELQASQRPPREVESVERIYPAPDADASFLGGGTLHLVKLAPRMVQADTGSGGVQGEEGKAKQKASRRARWKEERVLRVWTPPGFSQGGEGEPEGGYPVLFLNDGQNLFEDWLAHQGVSWGAGETVGRLIREGKLPPFLVVGIDSPGAFRSQVYLPYPPGTGDGDFRMDAARWPGGGVDSYMERVVHEILPLVQSQFGGSMRKEKLAFGGGSFGGVCALYAAMKYPDVFGSILAESPSFWAAEGRFLEDLRAHDGAWPDRVFMGVGTREYSGTREYENYDLDCKLLNYANEANGILQEKGFVSGESLRFEIGEGAGHHEGAWRYRLPSALEFLCERWSDC